jgi:pimeloyl-ACP methyl ester carboxylesterase
VRRSAALVAAVLLGLLGAGSAVRAQPIPGDRPMSAPGAFPFLSVEELRKMYGKPGGRVAHINGVDVWYMDEGKGPAILMIHGSNSSLRTWDGVADRLKGRYRVIRYDIPPQALSGAVSDEAVAKMTAIDIPTALLEQLGVKSVTVFGVSSGGTMGVQLAAAHPELVQRLVISNTPADPVVTDHLREPPAMKAAEAEAAKTGFQSQDYWNLFLDYFAGDPKRYDAAMRKQFYDINRRAPTKHRIGLTAVVADHAKAVAAMNAVKCPTLLIWGAADPLLVPKSANALEGYLTSAQVSKVFLSDVGHYPPIEVPERWTNLAVAFMQDAGPAPTH